MAETLAGKTSAVLATDGVEQVELTEPVKALRDAGAEVEVVSDKPDHIQAFRHHDKGVTIPVDSSLDEADLKDFDGLVLPGGVINPDALRLVPKAIAFVRHFVEVKKLIAAICHGPWTLIDAGGVSGKRMNSWPSLKTDLSNAGAKWADQEVVADGTLVTSRKPDDLPAFNKKAIEFSELRSTAGAASSETQSQPDPGAFIPEALMSDADRVWELMKKISICMFANWDGHELRARPMGAYVRKEDNAVFFLSDARHHGDSELQKYVKVCLAFADTSGQNYVSLAGHAEISRDPAKVRQLWGTPAKAWWSSPDDPNIRVLTVTPIEAEYWDAAGQDHRLHKDGRSRGHGQTA